MITKLPQGGNSLNSGVNKNRILHVSFSISKRNPRVLNAVNASAGSGYQADLISLKSDEYTFEREANGVRKYFCSVGFCGLNLRLIQYLIFFIRCALFISKRRNDYDAVFIHTMPDFLVFSAAAAKFSGKKVILGFSDMFPEVFAERKYGKVFFKLLVSIEKMSASFADYIFCVHEDHKKLLAGRSATGRKIEFVLNLPDPEILDDKKQTEKIGRKIFYAGSASARFGPDVAVRAFEKVLKEVPQAKLEILTGGNGAPEILKLVKKLGLTDNISFSGEFIEHKKAVKRMLSADLAVAPYRKSGFTDMVDSLKILEYAVAGIPFVCSDLKRIRKYFSDEDCYYAEAGDANSFAGKIITALNDYENSLEKAKKAKIAMAKYSFDEQMEKYRKVLEDIRRKTRIR